MHPDRTARPDERPCFNCGTTPAVRCCEFGADRRVPPLKQPPLKVMPG